MRVYWDVESHLIRPGMIMPRLVCVSYALDDGTTGLLGRDDGLRQMKIWLKEGNHDFAGHNVQYDFGVVAAEDPTTFIPLIFRAYEEGRVHDTKIRQQLIDIGNGELKFHVAEEGEEDLDEGEQARSILKTRYGLDVLARRLCGITIAKAGTWRLRYALLDGIPVERWPQDAKDYAIGDSVATKAVMDAQRERYPTKYLVNSTKQHQAAWALHLMSAWGIRTDGAAVKTLDEKLDRELAVAYAKLRDAKLVKPDTTKRHMKAIRARVVEAFTVLNEMPPLTKTGNEMVIRAAGKPVDLGNYISTAADTLKAAAKANAKKPLPKLEDLTPLLDPNVFKQMMDDFPFADLLVLAEAGKYGKLKTTYIPILLNGVRSPINASFNCLVESGRTSCARPNLQNLPRKGGVRECYTPRKSHVFATCDYDTLELRTLAQITIAIGCSTRFMADALIRGEDLHLSLAADLLGMSKEEAKAQYAGGDKKLEDHRQLAKCVTGDTFIHTTEGFVPVRELVPQRLAGFGPIRPVGVVSHKGVEIAAQSFYGGTQEVFEVRTDNGLSVKATEDHKLLTFRDDKTVWIECKDLKPGDYLFYRVGAEVHGEKVSLEPFEVQKNTNYKNLTLPEEITLDVARYLGLFVSEGRIDENGTGVAVSVCQSTKNDPDFCEKIDRVHEAVFGDRAKVRTDKDGNRHWVVSSVLLGEWLKHLGAGTDSATKQIPGVIRSSPRSFKVEFLRWLFEGDGSVTNRKTKSIGREKSRQRVVRYCSKSETLVKQIQLELLNFGIPSRVRPERRPYYGIYWNLVIAGKRHQQKFQDTIGFVSERKRRVLKSCLSGKRKDQPVLFLPGSDVLWKETRYEDLGCEKRELISRVFSRGGDVSEYVIDSLKSHIRGPVVDLVEQGVWCCKITKIKPAGREEVFDVWEPKHEVALFNGLVGYDCANFGLPGGMAARTFVDYAASGYGLTITQEMSEKICKSWKSTWKEMSEYFDFIKKSMEINDPENDVPTIKQIYSNRLRGDVTFTAASNSLFQGLAADGAKDALWEVTKECFLDKKSPLYGSHPVIFLHDEILIETPEEKASAAAKRLTEIMVSTMKKWVKDVPITATPVLFRRWWKGAKPVYDNKGNLLPCKPITDGNKVKWVHDPGDEACTSTSAPTAATLKTSTATAAQASP